MRHLFLLPLLPLLTACPPEVEPLDSSVPSPEVEALTPGEGPAVGGTRVTITGSDFHPSARVWFGAEPALSISVDPEGTEIRCTAPAGRDEVAVRVANPGGLEAEDKPTFTYVPGPTITGLDPDEGPESGDVAVHVTAEGLQDGLTATLGGKDLEVQTLTATGFHFMAPPGRGRATLVIENPDGQSDVLADAFVYVPPPRVRSVQPAVGPEAGGTAVTIVGSGYRAGATVTFGGAEATDVEVLGEARVRCVTPAGTGAVAVTVLDPDFEHAVPLAGGFEYLPVPVVEGVDPATGPERGGTRVRITGTGFLSGRTQVRFGGEAAVDLVYPADEEGVIEATTPPGAGTVAVLAVHDGIVSEPLEDAFAYVPPPVVTGLEPDFGPTAGGAAVAVLGEAFQDGARVWFGANEAPGVVVESDTRLVATTPPGDEGRVDVVVRNPDGQEGLWAQGYAYVPPPLLAGVRPPAGCETGGYEAELDGRDMTAGVRVWFGDDEADVEEFVSPDRVAVTVPAGRGTVDVRVENPDGQAHVLEDAFAYDTLPRPAALEPSHGPVEGGTAIEITGTCLGEVQGVRLGGVALVPFLVPDDGLITATTPAAEAEGRADLEVDGPDGELGVLEEAFSYHDGILQRAGALHDGDLMAGTSGAAVADLDGDGLSDLALAYAPGPQLMSVSDAVYRNSGGGSFDLAAQLGGANRHSMAVAAGDLDDDGRVDLVYGTSTEGPDGGRNVVYRNTGQLEFEELLPDGRGEPTLAVALPDVDGDGDLDLLFVGLTGARLCMNQGRMTFDVADVRLGEAGESGLFVAAAATDLDDDGAVDLLLASITDGVVLLENDGRGFFSDASERLPAANPDSANTLLLGDLDLDGDPDLLVGMRGPDRLWLQEEGDFVEATLGRLPELDAETTALALGDLDGDGDPDLVTGLGGASGVRNVLYVNDGTGVFVDASETRLPDVAPDRTQGLVLSDLDGDGVLDLFVANAGVDAVILD